MGKKNSESSFIQRYSNWLKKKSKNELVEYKDIKKMTTWREIPLEAEMIQS